MDVTCSKYHEAPRLFVSPGEATLEMTRNPFLDSFADPLCKLNLKETSDFVKSMPMTYNGTEGRGILEFPAQRRRDGGASSATRRNVEAPATPGRPIFSFSVGNFSRKAFPSKWDDAEKWLASSTACHDSPGSNHHRASKTTEPFKMSKQFSSFKPHQAEVFAEKSRVTEEKVSKVASSFQGPLHLGHHHNSVVAFNGVPVSTDVLLKDKFTNEEESTAEKSKQDANAEVFHEVEHKDVGTEMTPIGSCITSRCHTPFKSPSPVRHNTPANRSGPLAMTSTNSSNTIDIKELQECHLAKLQLGGSQFDSVTSHWSSREEEEEDISKSLRHFEINNEFRKSVSESRACAWEEEEKNNCCLRYQREEAKIQAWLKLQNAKAEAQSRKLEVKIQKMRLSLEEKLAKRMAIVNRKAEEWRVAAQLQHSEQIQKITQQAKKMNSQNSHFTGQKSCGCFPCNNHH